MTVSTALFTSDSGEWETPQELYDACDRRWGPFDLDAAASADNYLAPRFFDKHLDGLARVWEGRVWCNPPYGRGIEGWIAKASRSVANGTAERVVMLIPVRTDTRWWQGYIEKSVLTTVHFLPGRVKFGRAGEQGANSAPFPSAIVVFEEPFNV